jgi:hypothetical protein
MRSAARKLATQSTPSSITSGTRSSGRTPIERSAPATWPTLAARSA